MPFTRRQTLVALAFSFSILLIWRLQAAERSAIGATSNPLKHSSTQDEYEITHVEEEDVVRGWYMDEDKKRTEVGTGEKQKQIVAGEPPKVAEPKSEEKEGWIIPAVYSGKLSKLSAPTFPYKFSPTSPKSVLQAALLTAHISSNIPNTLIPRIIHQTWRTRKVGSNMPVHVADSIESWRKENPDYIHLLWDDKDMDDFISTFWPSYWQAWKAFPMPVMRADVFRYLVLVTFGGVYTDADTLCLRPVDRWVEAKELEGWTYPPRESSKAPRKAFPTVGPSTVAFIGGLETDVPFDREDWTGIYHVPMQICQWTMASSPLHHIPLRAAANVLENVRNPRVSDAPSLTGPAPWTDAIYSHWKEYGVDPEELRAFGNKGRVVGDSLILPITGFSPGLGQVLITIFGDMGAGKIEDPEARVRHLWKGTWRS